MHKYSLILIICYLLLLNCAGFREIERKDPLGRVIHVAYYDGATLIRDEELKYYGNSHNPSQIIYKKKSGLDMAPYKEESYQFENNNLLKLSFYIYKDNKKINTGMIVYSYYRNNKLKRIEYYSFEESMNQMYIFGLDQYTYKDDRLVSRRIIEYELNRENQQPMQIGHYVISFKDEQIDSMKLSIMDKVSKKIIENNFPDGDLVYKKIENLEDTYIRKSRGKEFLKK